MLYSEYRNTNKAFQNELKTQKKEKEETTMAAVEAKDRKKELVEKTAEQFQQLNEDNKMFILGYMLGIQQERQRTTPQPQTA